MESDCGTLLTIKTFHPRLTMAKIIAAINTTIDGFCDHTAGIPDEALHDHYTDLLSNADAILYGRITYQLMEYWRPIAKDPTGNQAIDAFAVVMDKIPKIVFSNTLKELDWDSATLAQRDLEEEVSALKRQPGKPILVGSPSLIVALHKLGLIDEYQICIHPVILGSGLPLFKNIQERAVLKLINTKTFGSGAITLYYEPSNQ
jgi:dihydrofolate reductase